MIRIARKSITRERSLTASAVPTATVWDAAHPRDNRSRKNKNQAPTTQRDPSKVLASLALMRHWRTSLRQLTWVKAFHLRTP